MNNKKELLLSGINITDHSIKKNFLCPLISNLNFKIYAQEKNAFLFDNKKSLQMFVDILNSKKQFFGYLKLNLLNDEEILYFNEKKKDKNKKYLNHYIDEIKINNKSKMFLFDNIFNYFINTLDFNQNFLYDKIKNNIFKINKKILNIFDINLKIDLKNIAFLKKKNEYLYKLKNSLDNYSFNTHLSCIQWSEEYKKILKKIKILEYSSFLDQMNIIISNILDENLYNKNNLEKIQDEISKIKLKIDSIKNPKNNLQNPINKKLYKIREKNLLFLISKEDEFKKEIMNQKKILNYLKFKQQNKNLEKDVLIHQCKIMILTKFLKFVKKNKKNILYLQQDQMDDFLYSLNEFFFLFLLEFKNNNLFKKRTIKSKINKIFYFDIKKYIEYSKENLNLIKKENNLKFNSKNKNVDEKEKSFQNTNNLNLQELKENEFLLKQLEKKYNDELENEEWFLTKETILFDNKKNTNLEEIKILKQQNESLKEEINNMFNKVKANFESFNLLNEINQIYEKENSIKCTPQENELFLEKNEIKPNKNFFNSLKQYVIIYYMDLFKLDKHLLSCSYKSLNNYQKIILKIFRSFLTNKQIVIFNQCSEKVTTKEFGAIINLINLINVYNDKIGWIFVDIDFEKLKNGNYIDYLNIFYNSKDIEYGKFNEIFFSPINPITKNLLLKSANTVSEAAKNSSINIKSYFDWNDNYDNFKLTESHYVYCTINQFYKWTNKIPLQSKNTFKNYEIEKLKTEIAFKQNKKDKNNDDYNNQQSFEKTIEKVIIDFSDEI